MNSLMLGRTRWLIWAGFLSIIFLPLGACAHGGTPVGSSSGNTSGGGTSQPFVQTDFAGDWVGYITPSDPLQAERAVYLRFDSTGRLIECADSSAYEWYLQTSTFSASLAEQGDLAVSMQTAYGPNWAQVFTGTMDASRAAMEGVFELSKDGSRLQDGSFTLTRAQSGFFTGSTHLAGSWTGPAFNDNHKGVTLNLELDEFGSVQAGSLTWGPLQNWEEIHDYLLDGTNDGVFTFFDDGVGRLENVSLYSSDGAITTLRYLIISQDGSIMGGPGSDTDLGMGSARLVRLP